MLAPRYGLLLGAIFSALLSGQSLSAAAQTIKSPSTPARVSLDGGQLQEAYAHSAALVIGESHYTRWDALPGALPDARAIAEALRSQGFVTELHLDLGASALRQVLSSFLQTHGATESTRLVLYFSGHAFALPRVHSMGGQEVFLVPVDAHPQQVEQQDALARRALGLDGLLSLTEAARARHILVVLDACYAGAQLATTRPRPRSRLSETSLDRARFILTSVSGTQRASDDGAFRLALLRGLGGAADLNADQVVSTHELAVYLQDRGRGQAPQLEVYPASSQGELLFLPAKPPALKGEAMLYLNAVPPASLLLNGKPRGNSPLDRLRLPAGPYTVQARWPGEESPEYTVKLLPGGELHCVLEQISGTFCCRGGEDELPCANRLSAP